MRLLQATPVKLSRFSMARLAQYASWKAKWQRRCAALGTELPQGSRFQGTRQLRSAKRGLSCHRDTAMTVWPMRSGILPSIRLLASLAEVTVPLQHPPFRQTLEFSAQRLPATVSAIAGGQLYQSHRLPDSRAVAVTNLRWPAHTCSESAQSNEMEVRSCAC